MLTRKYFAIRNELEKAKKDAYSILDNIERTDKLYPYHTKEHTAEFVLPAALRLADLEGFSLEERLLMGVAAVFHETGMIKDYNKHEISSAEFAESYMGESEYDYTEGGIAIVKNAIKKTDPDKAPESKYSGVLKDADLSYIGGKRYMELQSRLREELEIHPESPNHRKTLDDAEWREFQLDFLNSHKWFTKSAERLYGEIKKENIAKIIEHYKLAPQSL